MLAQSAAAALGRKVDQLIIDVLDAGSNSNNVVHGSAGLTLAKALTVYESFGEADVPDDGQKDTSLYLQQAGLIYYKSTSSQEWSTLARVTYHMLAV